METYRIRILWTRGGYYVDSPHLTTREAADRAFQYCIDKHAYTVEMVVFKDSIWNRVARRYQAGIQGVRK